MDNVGRAALAVAVGAGLLGVAYYAYLVATPFPPPAARAVPFVWLVAALAGLGLGATTARAASRRAIGVAAVLLSLPSLAFAAIFALAAAMGD